MNDIPTIRRPSCNVVGLTLLLFAMASAPTLAMDMPTAEAETRIGLLERRVAELERASSSRAPAVGQYSDAHARQGGQTFYTTGNQDQTARFWADYWSSHRHNGH